MKVAFTNNSELYDNVYYFDDQCNIRHFTDSNTLEAKENLQNIKYNLRQPLHWWWKRCGTLAYVGRQPCHNPKEAKQTATATLGLN